MESFVLQAENEQEKSMALRVRQSENNGKTTLFFQDNRSAAAVQRKLGEIMQKSGNKADIVQKVELDEEELMQGKAAQLVPEEEEEELMQGKFFSKNNTRITEN